MVGFSTNYRIHDVALSANSLRHLSRLPEVVLFILEFCTVGVGEMGGGTKYHSDYSNCDNTPTLRWTHYSMTDWSGYNVTDKLVFPLT